MLLLIFYWQGCSFLNVGSDAAGLLAIRWVHTRLTEYTCGLFDSRNGPDKSNSCISVDNVGWGKLDINRDRPYKPSEGRCLLIGNPLDRDTSGSEKDKSGKCCRSFRFEGSSHASNWIRSSKQSYGPQLDDAWHYCEEIKRRPIHLIFAEPQLIFLVFRLYCT